MLAVAVLDLRCRRVDRAIANVRDVDDLRPAHRVDVERELVTDDLAGELVEAVVEGRRAELRASVGHAGRDLAARDGADEMVGDGPEVEQVADAPIGPHVETEKRLVGHRAARDARRPLTQDRVRIRGVEAREARGDRVHAVPFAVIVAASAQLGRAVHAVEPVVQEGLAHLVAVIALRSRGVSLEVIVVLVRVGIVDRVVPRLVDVGEAIDADIAPRLVPLAEHRLVRVAHPVAIQIDGERDIDMGNHSPACGGIHWSS